ncbi:hypothetical protein SUGI_0541620 [Cryptomeria japonica]|nr:hypothetical protein SUGI_0541620 [Cryptomeria japonica]
MAGFGVPLVAAIGVYCCLHPNTLEIRPRSNSKTKEFGADEERASRKNRGRLVFAPEFDGLHCYENLIYARSLRVVEKGEDKIAGFGVPPVAAATVAIRVYCRLPPHSLKNRGNYNSETKELSADEQRSSRKSRGGLVFGPQFDGLNFYENYDVWLNQF